MLEPLQDARGSLLKLPFYDDLELGSHGMHCVYLNLLINYSSPLIFSQIASPRRLNSFV